MSDTLLCVRARALTVATDFGEIWHRRLEPDVKVLFRWGYGKGKVHLGYPLFLPHFTKNWHLHNTFQWEY